MKIKVLNRNHDSSYRVIKEDIRCCCGKLLAKRNKSSIIIRCSRCKREVMIEFSESEIEFA